MHAEDTPEDAYDRGVEAGSRLLLPLCPYPRRQAHLREAWNIGVAVGLRRLATAQAVEPNPRRAQLMIAAGAVS